LDATTATHLFQRIEREVWIVTAAHEGHRAGLVATFINPASIVPQMPRIVAGIAKTHETWKLIEASGAFALHLVDESQLDLVWRFGLQSSRDADKFAGVETTVAATGSPIVCEALAWLDCRVEGRLDTGDRTIFLAAVVDAAILRDQRPLNLQRLLQIAPDEKRAILCEQMTADAARDVEAITEWRKARP
jgi:flavin reductase (DIM6/NTAB) family NADH-FMN oxidoreductase RutF